MKTGITRITSTQARGAKPSYHYIRVIQAYKEWLTLLGYATSTINTLMPKINSFLIYLDALQIKSLELVPKNVIDSYYHYLKYKKSCITGGMLKKSTLNLYLRNLLLFNDYLQQTQQGKLIVDIRYETLQQTPQQVLTTKQVQHLYHACEENISGLRDRAILSLYYGCGLRRQEGILLNIKDIIFEKHLIHIRKSKNRKARYVPFVKKQRHDFILYLKYCRPQCMALKNEKAFLINNQGRRISKAMLYNSIKKIIQRTHNQNIQSLKISLHTLRHSIATHLLMQGMNIHDISLFLGHQSIRSTQNYLHHELL